MSFRCVVRKATNYHSVAGLSHTFTLKTFAHIAKAVISSNDLSRFSLIQLIDTEVVS